MALLIALHVLAAVVWVGGMFFAYIVLRPSAGPLQAEARLRLWQRVFQRFFPWVWASVVLLLVSGYGMIFLYFGGFAGTRPSIHFMQGIGIVMMLLDFAQTNRGMTRVLIGDALVNENERLQERMNQFLDRIESSVKQSFRTAASNAELPQQFDAAARSALVIAFVVGRWHRFAKTGFRKAPTENIDAQLSVLLV